MKRNSLRLTFLAMAATGFLAACDSSTGSNGSGGGGSTNVTYGTLADARDGKTYKTVTIGTQTWMAQNLNYRNTTGSSDTFGTCYKFRTDSCTKYGRLYTWMAAVDTGSGFGEDSVMIASPRTGICPSGWHVPSDTEWGTLVAFAGSSDARVRLSSTTGWDNSICSPMGWTCNGTDDYGFRVLPAGSANVTDIVDTVGFMSAGSFAAFLSVTETGNFDLWERSFSQSSTAVSRNPTYKSWSFSLRCIRN
ncbi:MAG TPA: FISUMP domain-containing protein [Fibrobacteria bacterium]|nr:FISUMP domain-containing protein [Fibrobacteria bacterium]